MEVCDMLQWRFHLFHLLEVWIFESLVETIAVVVEEDFLISVEFFDVVHSADNEASRIEQVIVIFFLFGEYDSTASASMDLVILIYVVEEVHRNLVVACQRKS